jgi:RND family efflux transporter MFP subunit
VREVKREIWPQTVPVQGSLLGDETALIGSKLAGLVDQVKVDLGTRVHQGELLVLLDQRDLKLRVSQAEAQLNQACAAIGISPAESEHELDRESAPPVMLERALVDEATTSFGRAERLRTKQAIAEGEFDRLYAQMKTAQARYQSALNSVGEAIAVISLRRVELAVAKQTLADSEIVAPFDGVVSQRLIAKGEYVQPGQALVNLIRTDRLRFTAGVPERQANKIHNGQVVHVFLPGLENPLVTQISRTSPLVTLSSRSLLVEADMINSESNFQAGLFAEAEIIIDPTAETLTVPTRSVAEFAGVQKVWRVREGKAEEVSIVTGRKNSHRVEVLSGLEVGDIVVKHYTEGHAGAIATFMKASTPSRATAVVNTPEEGATN